MPTTLASKDARVTLPANLPPGAHLRLLRAAHGLPAGSVLRPLNRSLSRSTERDLSAGASKTPASMRPGQIGTTDEETGRPVLQASESRAKVQEAASAEHPAVRARLEAALGEVPGAALSGDRRSKDPERVEEKEEDGKPVSTQPDFSGFRVSADTREAARGAAAQLKRHFDVVHEQDEFEQGNPETGFHAHLLQVRMTPKPGDHGAERAAGSGVTHEVQILPREVAETAEANHPLYEKAREGDKGAQGELRKRNSASWNAFEKRTGGNDAVPEQGAGSLLQRAPEEAGSPGSQRGGVEPREQGAHTATPRGAEEKASGAAGKVEPRYKFRSTQHNIDPGSEAAKALSKARSQVADEDLAGDGRDVGGDHVTVRYGLKNDDIEGVRKYLEKQAPFTASLGGTRAFPPSENSDGAAPLHAPVESKDLERIHNEIARHGDFKESDFASYKPHATIAYVKPEAAKNYTGNQTTAGKKFRVESIAITDRDGNQQEVPLRGQERATNGAPIPVKTPPPGPAKFKPGRQSTPVLVKDDGGNRLHATLDYFNDGSNGQARRGRLTLANGFKMNNVPENRIEPAAEDAVTAAGGGRAGDHWIGVDLDGTLAHYESFEGATKIGAPIPAMVERVKQMLAAGNDVRIFTARIGNDPDGRVRRAIEGWLEKHIGRKLPITNVKDDHMSKLFDDRAVSVARNTGAVTSPVNTGS